MKKRILVKKKKNVFLGEEYKIVKLNSGIITDMFLRFR